MKGTTVIHTRSLDDAEPLATLLAARGAYVLHAPMVRFTAPAPDDATQLAAAVKNLRDYALVAFTSPRAVQSIPPPPGGAAYNAVALGRRTHAAAQAAGWRVLNPVDLPHAAALTEWMVGHIPLRGARILWPTSNVAAPAVAPLKKAGAIVDVHVAYQTAPAQHVPLDVMAALESRAAHALICMSPSAADAWCALVPQALTLPLIRVAPGKTTAAAFQRAGLPATVVSADAEPATVVDALGRVLKPR